MGTLYYFARDDNRTCFEMGKAYGLAHELRERHQTWNEPVRVGVLDATQLRVDIEKQYGQYESVFSPEQLDDMTARILAFADGQPVVFIDEHNERLDYNPDCYKEVGDFWPPGFVLPQNR